MSRNPFVLTATHFGPMLVNRLDFHRYGEGCGFLGVGCDLLEHGEYRRAEIERCFACISDQRTRRGDGAVVLDIGANIGTHTIAWAKQMEGWGHVMAIEPQERVYYALAGNIALNNCFNVRALWGAAAAQSGFMKMPRLDHQQPCNFGGLSLRGSAKDDSPKPVGEEEIETFAVDDFELRRLDFMKIDVEGMELEVLEGARKTIARHRPVIVIEANFEVAAFMSFCPAYRASNFDDLNVILEPDVLKPAA